MRYKLKVSQVVEQIINNYTYTKIYTYDINGRLIECNINNGNVYSPKIVYKYDGNKLTHINRHDNLYVIHYINGRMNSGYAIRDILYDDNGLIESYTKGGDIRVTYENNIPVRLESFYPYYIHHTNIKTLNYGNVDKTIQYLL